VIGTVNSIVRRGLVTPLFEEEGNLTIKSVRGLLLVEELARRVSKERGIHIRSGEGKPEELQA
jgi:hypothetical protein